MLFLFYVTYACYIFSSYITCKLHACNPYNSFTLLPRHSNDHKDDLSHKGTSGEIPVIPRVDNVRSSGTEYVCYHIFIHSHLDYKPISAIDEGFIRHVNDILVDPDTGNFIDLNTNDDSINPKMDSFVVNLSSHKLSQDEITVLTRHHMPLDHKVYRILQQQGIISI